MRTTIDIDDAILRDLKRLQQREGKSLGRLVSDLLAPALARGRPRAIEPVALVWLSRPMAARLDIADHGAALDAMDEPPP